MLTDFEPAGIRIQDSFVGSLEQDFNYCPEIIAFRAAITKDQIEKYNLHSDMEANKRDGNYKEFIQNTGMTKAYELEALPPKILMQEIEKAVMEVIDLDRYNQGFDP